jgi:hypothetical protein
MSERPLGEMLPARLLLSAVPSGRKEVLAAFAAHKGEVTAGYSQ